MLNWADVTIVGIIALSTLISFFRGLVKEILSLATWIIAFVIAFKFFDSLANYFVPYIQTTSLRRAIAFAIIFGTILLLGTVISHFFAQLVSKSGLHGPDRTLGIFFGFGRGILIVGILLLLASLNDLKQETWWTQSKLIPYFDSMITWLGTFIPEKVNNAAKNPPAKEDVAITPE
jgi:membrane protein required for colicin V production